MAYPIIYFFTSPYCAPCKNVERMLNEINISLFGNRLHIKKINIVEDLEMAQKFKVSSVPTIIIGAQRLNMIIDKEELINAILSGFLSSITFDEENGDSDEKMQ